MTTTDHVVMMILNAIVMMAHRLGYIVTVNANDSEPLSDSDNTVAVVDACGAYRNVTLFFGAKHRHGRYKGDGFRYDCIAFVKLDFDKGVNCIGYNSDQYGGEDDPNHIAVNHIDEILSHARSIQRAFAAPV